MFIVLPLIDSGCNAKSHGTIQILTILPFIRHREKLIASVTQSHATKEEEKIKLMMWIISSVSHMFTHHWYIVKKNTRIVWCFFFLSFTLRRYITIQRHLWHGTWNVSFFFFRIHIVVGAFNSLTHFFLCPHKFYMNWTPTKQSVWEHISFISFAIRKRMCKVWHTHSLIHTIFDMSKCHILHITTKKKS